MIIMNILSLFGACALTALCGLDTSQYNNNTVTDNYIYNENIGYYVLNNDYDIYTPSLYSDLVVGLNKQVGYYNFIIGNTLYQNVRDLSHNIGLNGTYLRFSYDYYDTDTSTVITLTMNALTNDLSQSDFIVKFTSIYTYDAQLSNAFTSLARLYNYDDDAYILSSNYYYKLIDLYLAPSLVLSPSYLTLDYSLLNSTLYHYGSEALYYFDRLQVSYNRGLILSLSGINYNLYDKAFYGDDFLYKLNNNVLPYLHDVGVYCQSALTQQQYTQLINDNLIYDGSIITNATYSLQTLFYNGYNELPSVTEQYTRSYYLIYTSNGIKYNKIDIEYHSVVSGLSAYAYKVTYSNTMVSNSSIVVLEVIASIGNSGWSYSFNTRLEEYQLFYYRDYFGASIQEFLRDYSYKNIVSSTANGDIFNIFDLFSGAFNSFSAILSMQILPGITIGLLVFLPFVALIIFFIISLFKR